MRGRKSKSCSLNPCPLVQSRPLLSPPFFIPPSLSPQGYSFVAPSVIFSENAISDAIFSSTSAQPGTANGAHPGPKLKVNPGTNLTSIFQDDKRPGDIALMNKIKSPFTDKYELLNEDGFLGWLNFKFML